MNAEYEPFADEMNNAKMTNEQVDEYLALLRSGKYRQIRMVYTDLGNGRCAAGILRSHPGFWRNVPHDTVDELVKMNDEQGQTFEDIANWVELHRHRFTASMGERQVSSVAGY